MKVSKEQAAANRAAIVDAAERLFRERGFDGVGVAEITRAAGLTHGGFYGHFASKEALAAEACEVAFDKSRARAARAADFAAYVGNYLSARHRDRPEAGCPMPAYATEVGRQGADVQARFAEGVERFIGRVAELLDSSAERGPAITVLATLVGAMSLARATADAAPDLSEEIMTAVREELVTAYPTSTRQS